MGQKSTDYESPRNDWISPYFVLTYHHSRCADEAQEAVGSILRNASKTAHREPWTVMHNGTLSPDGNPRSYVSWAPYWWPSCCQDVETSNNAGGVDPDQSSDELKKRQTSSKGKDLKKRDQALSQQTSQVSSSLPPAGEMSLKASSQSLDNCAPEGSQSDPTLIYKNCVYIRRDGVRNPDDDLLPCRETWIEISKAVLSNALAYGLTRDETFAQKAVTFIRTFFLDPRTGVLPNINYGQIIRGPPGASNGQNDWSKGTFRGLIEWRHILNIVNSIVMIRACGSKSWSTLDAAQMSKWASDYLHWLETSDIALQTRDNKNNMASFYYNQVISLYIVLGKTEQASTQANEYFTNSFMGQIDQQGNQPLESTRTRSFHYLTFGLEAMMANAKLADNLGLNMWCAKTLKNTTIQDAVDYILNLANNNFINGNSDTEVNDYSDFAAHVATTLTAYGDRPDGRYQKYLSNPQLTGDPNQLRSWRLYNLPCSFYSSPSKGHSVSSQKFN